MATRAEAQSPAASELVAAALELDAYAVARLVSLFQDRRREAVPQRVEVLAELDRRKASEGAVIGITGTPGSGKSSLIGRLAIELLAGDEQLSIAVLAIDPSSHLSGGALLGDRTRLRAPGVDNRLFFRSEASDTELGGLSPSSFQVCRLLVRLYDCVIVETVGIGQSEADIRHLADRVYLVLAPLGGDDVQFMKAGIVEIPDAFIVNKCDEPSAEASYGQLRSSLWLARPFDAEELPIFRTSARTGQGVGELAADLAELIDGGGATELAAREPHFLERWVREEWGRVGVSHLAEELGGARALLASAGGFDAAQAAFDDRLRAALRGEAGRP